jgi:hypothetical protein
MGGNGDQGWCVSLCTADKLWARGSHAVDLGQACTYGGEGGRVFAGEARRVRSCLKRRRAVRFLACSGSCVQVGDAAVAAGGLVVVGFGVVKRKIRWRFQVGSDVVPMRLVCDGGRDDGSGAERRGVRAVGGMKCVFW